MSDLAALEAVLGHTFSDGGLLERALTHRSFSNEQPRPKPEDNERLEFLGDAALGLVVGHMLMTEHPELSEGELSVHRATLVSEDGLAAVARDIGLGQWLRLGKGEARGGGDGKKSLLADTFEAVVAAVYLDAGFPAAEALVKKWLGARVRDLDKQATVDWKTRLQEATQAEHKIAPRYELVEEEGPDHDKRFTVAVTVAGEERARGQGKSKKAAEQAAAKAACAATE